MYIIERQAAEERLMYEIVKEGYYSEGNQEGYYIAEASGYQNDIRVIKRSISSLSSTNKIGEMTYHYKNSRVSDYKSAFDKGRLD